MNASVMRFFQQAVHAWLIGYTLLLLLLGKSAWSSAAVDAFPSQSLFAGVVPAVMNAITPVVGMALCGVLLLCSAALLLKHRAWLALLVWFIFRLITHRTWLASNGGIQLMENMLLWAALLSVVPGRLAPPIATTAFWIARLQLLLVYAAAAVHKFTGSTWLDGSAVSIIAADPAFRLEWMQRSPWVCTIATYAALTFMTAFPIAVWWRASRRVILCAGACFHLFTALFMGIPQMAFAFLACYTLWLDEDEVLALRSFVRVWMERAERSLHPRSAAR